MDYTKLPIDILSQIGLLKRRGLCFNNEETAASKLRNISYYRLANYWRSMEADKSAHIFKPGSKFDDVIRLYEFDMKLRSLLFSAIQVVEIALRSKIIHHFSLRYGSFWFMDGSLFKSTGIHSHCMRNIDDEVKRTKEEFILEHFAKYSSPAYPPVWKTLEVVSFGTLSKLYCNFADNATKKDIAGELGLPQHLYLESWITSMAVLRNCCAHHARIWNRVFSIKPGLPKTLSNPWISDRGTNPSKLYPQLCTMLYLMRGINPETQFRKDIISLLDEYPSVDTSAMGFPSNWKSEPLWK